MNYKNCKGYTLYKATCSDCDFEECINSITMRCTRAKLSVEDGDKCPNTDCEGTIMVEEIEVDEDQHKQEYLNHFEGD